MAQTEVLDAPSAMNPAFNKPLTEETIPELEAGDRLTRREFHRRYEAMPHLKKAELIEGVVYVISPVKRNHGKYTSWINAWLTIYSFATPGTETADNATTVLDEDNEPQPDVYLRIEEDYDGQSWPDENDYVTGAPELVAEVTSSSASYDLHDKKNAYRRNGVKEYIVWRVKDQQLDWFVLQEGGFVQLAPDADGIIESTVFPGLRLAVSSLLSGDMPTVMAELQKGIASPAHQAFVASLQSKKANT
ncbi:MAG TPA: Uma2 family endonuclease [Blastocatellia bacterium]|nr:Uma2 family endonuclease [Blastocatellia bacterium]